MTNFEADISTMREQLKGLSSRLEKAERNIEEIHCLSRDIALLSSNVKIVSEDVKEIKKKVDQIEKEPADDMKRYKREITIMIIGSILGFIIGRLLELI